MEFCIVFVWFLVVGQMLVKIEDIYIMQYEEVSLDWVLFNYSECK